MSPVAFAYEKAVVSVLNAVPDIAEDEAENMVEAIVDLVLATLQNELNRTEQ
jgi:hypothetical protein